MKEDLQYTPILPDCDGTDCILTYVHVIMRVLGRHPERAPRPSRLQSHMTLRNVDFIDIGERGNGWGVEIVFRDVPKGLEDCVRTPLAKPYKSYNEAFMAGITLYCQLFYGSPIHPFILCGNKLTLSRSVNVMNAH